MRNRSRSRSPVRRRSRSRSPHRPTMRGRREVRNQSCRVYISNLNYDVKWMHVKDVFKKLGNVEHVEIFTDNDGRSKGCAIVEFAESQDAAHAIKELDGTDIAGRKIRVREDTKGDDVYKEQLKTQKEKSRGQRSDLQSSYMPQLGLTGFAGGLGAGLGGGYGAAGLGSAGMATAGMATALGAGFGSNMGANVGGLSGNLALASSIPGLGGLQAMLSVQATQALTLLNSLNQKSGDPLNCSVFISNLDYEVPWQRLKDTMRRAGNCVRCDLATGENKKSKGFGTVVFETPMEAITAVALFNGVETGLSKRPMSVRLDRNATLHQVLQQLGIDSSNISQQTLLQFQQLATTAVLSANQLGGATGLGAGLGVGSNLTGLGNLSSLASLTSGSASGTGVGAMRSVGNVNHSGYVDTQRNSSVGGGRSSGGGNSQAKLFVRNLPFSVKWQDLKDKFREAGRVERAEIKLDSDNRSKGFGTIIFDSVNGAQNAINLFNGYRWDGREIEVKFDRY